ncbi:MAG: type I-C CRISPR-associated endonuclease Cas1c [Mariprofundaceae bacterium]|nr:type I-C CRISPR-associated endonuclease Cas1c [Mariprofundaceae bacterium]
MRKILNTMYVMSQGSYLHLERETLKLDIEKKTVSRIPMHHIGDVVLFGNVMVSPFMLHRCAEDGRSVIFLSEYGRFKARLIGPQSGNVFLRRAQHLLLDEDRSLDLVKALLAGKIQNTRSLVLRSAREAKNEQDQSMLKEIAKSLARSLLDLPSATDLDQLRGIEGYAAKTYFHGFSSMIRKNRDDFLMNGRSRRPPKDRINALLSFLYAMLSNDCSSALESVGLDPQVGYLHALRSGRPALALDLMEEFRPIFADRLALTLVNRQQLKGSDFTERTGGAWEMSDGARKIILTAVQNRKQEEIMHPELKEKIPLGLAILIQARLMARFIRGESSEYIPFMPR